MILFYEHVLDAELNQVTTNQLCIPHLCIITVVGRLPPFVDLLVMVKMHNHQLDQNWWLNIHWWYPHCWFERPRFVEFAMAPMARGKRKTSTWYLKTLEQIESWKVNPQVPSPWAANSEASEAMRNHRKPMGFAQRRNPWVSVVQLADQNQKSRSSFSSVTVCIESKYVELFNGTFAMLHCSGLVWEGVQVRISLGWHLKHQVTSSHISVCYGLRRGCFFVKHAKILISKEDLEL